MGRRHQGHAEAFPAHHQSKAKEGDVKFTQEATAGARNSARTVAPATRHQFICADDKLSVRLVPM